MRNVEIKVNFKYQSMVFRVYLGVKKIETSKWVNFILKIMVVQCVFGVENQVLQKPLFLNYCHLCISEECFANGISGRICKPVITNLPGLNLSTFQIHVIHSFLWNAYANQPAS